MKGLNAPFYKFMADNTQLNPGVGGDNISTDDVGGGVKVQRVKMQIGTDGTASDIHDGNPLPVADSAAEISLAAINVDTTAIKATVYTEGAVAPSIKGVATMMEIDGNTLMPIQGMLADGKHGLVTITPGHISMLNSTKSILSPNAVFTGGWEDIVNHGIVIISIKSSHNSATDGLVVQFSSDGINFDLTDDKYTIYSDEAKTISVQCGAKYFRVVYTNGPTTQDSFVLQTSLKPAYAKPSSHRILDTVSLQDDAELVKAVIAGETTAGGGASVNVKVTPSGALISETTRNPVTPTKSGNNTLLALQSVAANTVVMSSTVDVSTKWGAFLSIKIGRRSTSAAGAGVNVRIEGSPDASGNHWATLYQLMSGFEACSSVAVSGTVNSGQNVITVGNTTGFSVGDLIYIDNGTIANSEWHRIKSVVTNTSVTVEDNLANAQTGATIYDLSDVFNGVNINLENIMRLRVVVDGANYTQSFAVNIKASYLNSIV